MRRRLDGAARGLRRARRRREPLSADDPFDFRHGRARKGAPREWLAEVLRGEWLGHALHPVMTAVVIGTWTSATLLDWLGGDDDSRAAGRLIGIGLLAAGPTAWTGWAEWSGADRAPQRVGVVHAVSNGVAIGAFAGSLGGPAPGSPAGRQGAGAGRCRRPQSGRLPRGPPRPRPPTNGLTETLVRQPATRQEPSGDRSARPIVANCSRRAARVGSPAPTMPDAYCTFSHPRFSARLPVPLPARSSRLR